MLEREARAELLVAAVGLTLDERAPDCLSRATLAVSEETRILVEWHTDGVHGPSDLPGVWIEAESALADPRGVETLASELVEVEVGRHLAEDHHRRE